jgi:glucosyl-3-phosphoglycerate synthase
VETAALIDTVRRLGVDAIAQVDLGRRAHRHQALRDLGAMATQIVAAAIARASKEAPTSLGATIPLRQYHPVDGRIAPVVHDVAVGERPPAEEFLR